MILTNIRSMKFGISMTSFELTSHSRILFQPSHAPDRLEGDSDREPNFYDDFYQQTENPLKEVRTHQFQLLLDECDSLITKGKHLDIGCGDGLFVEVCRNTKQIDSSGIDAHAPSGKPHIMRKSLEELIEEASSGGATSKDFATLSLLDVLEHFKDPDATLQSLKKIMNPSSHLLIKVPSKNSLLYRLSKAFMHVLPGLARANFIRMYQVHYPPPHYYYYNLESLTGLLEKNGFAVLKHGYVSETPVQALHKRLWNIKPVLRPVAYLVLLGMQLITPRTMYDGLFVIAKTK